MRQAFSATRLYGTTNSDEMPPKVMLAPTRYIQGPNVLQHIGRYLGTLSARRFAVLASARGHRAQAAQVADSLRNFDLQAIPLVFGGECSLEEIERQAESLGTERVECLIAVGGGKCVDAGKSIAYRLNVPVVIVPTVASNDAPCSALSVLYSPQGAKSSVEVFPCSPVLVLVDTAVVAEAGERYLVSGMGDAMATWYEARVCITNPLARTGLGARPSMTAAALGELCAHTLYEHGLAAAHAVRCDCVDDALERVVEANTLLSGVGFESGGLAAAHGFAQGFTNVHDVEANYLHGEMVAMGVLAQLMMEGDNAEAQRVARFFVSVGLPIHLGQLGMNQDRRSELDDVTDGAMTFGPLANFPFQVTPEKIRRALLSADELGRRLTSELGDDAYRHVHR